MNEPEIAPLARRLAEENRVDWRRLRGSGEGGEVVERDVLAYLARVMAGEEATDPGPESAPHDGAAGARPPGEDVPGADPFDDADDLLLAGDDLRPMEEDAAPEPGAGRREAAPADPFGGFDDDLVWDAEPAETAPRAADASEREPVSPEDADEALDAGIADDPSADADVPEASPRVAEEDPYFVDPAPDGLGWFLEDDEEGVEPPASTSSPSAGPDAPVPEPLRDAPPAPEPPHDDPFASAPSYDRFVPDPPRDDPFAPEPSAAGAAWTDDLPRAFDVEEAAAAAYDEAPAPPDRPEPEAAPPGEATEAFGAAGGADDRSAGPAVVRGRRTLRRHVALDGVRTVERLLATETGDDRLARAALLLLAARRAGGRLEIARPVVVRFADGGTVLATAEDGLLGETARVLATPATGAERDADLYVADLFELDLDEAVLDVEGPQLTLGRGIDAPDGARAVLSLTGDVPPERGAAFLAAVAELVEEPLRLLV